MNKNAPLRHRIYTVIEKSDGTDKLSQAYDIFIMIVAFISVTPLMFKGFHPILVQIDIVTVYILFFDYIFRWMTYDYRKKIYHPWIFFVYPFTFFAVTDLLSLLPSLGVLGGGFKVLRMLRIFKVLQYSKSYIYISNVFRKERKTLGSVLVIALAYIFISALAMFSFEPESFGTFFDALYWATTALTTVGYGDVYPVSVIGRTISMISSLFGIAIIALPAGIVTAGFVDEINSEVKNSQSKKEAADEDDQ